MTVFKPRYKYERGDWRAVVSGFAGKERNAEKPVKCRLCLALTNTPNENPEPSGSEAAVLTASKSGQSFDFSNDTQGDAVSVRPGSFGVTPSQRPGPDGCRTHTVSGGGLLMVLMAPVLQVVLQPRHHPSTRRITRTTFTWSTTAAAAVLRSL